MSTLYNIKVIRVPMKSTDVAINQISSEIKANNTDSGSVDLVWINGEKFNTARNLKLLYGPFAIKLPSAANFDFGSAPIMYDFGRTTNSYEMPLNQAQFVFIYNTKYFPTGPPKTLPDFVSWVKANPGKFTYPNPVTDFTGAAFIRHFLYYYPTTDANSYKDMLGDFSTANYLRHAPHAFYVLRELNSSLYLKNGKPYFPVNVTEADNMFGNEAIWMTVSYLPAHAGQMVASGKWKNRFLLYFNNIKNPFHHSFIHPPYYS